MPKAHIYLNKKKTKINFFGDFELTPTGLIVRDAAYRSRILFSINSGHFSYAGIYKDWECAK